MDAESANARRCAKRGGCYEAWYVTVGDPAARRGYWIRYTTFSPAAGAGAPAHSALWAFGFDRKDPGSNWGGKQSFPLDALESRSNPFGLRLGKAEMDPAGCAGELTCERGVARWDLKWTSRERPFPFVNPRFQGLSTVANIGAQPALTVTGTIELDGRVHRLEGAPGGQQHTWGASHALEWNWGFACGQDFWIDGVTSRVRSRLGRVLAGTAIGATVGHESFRSNGLRQVLRNPGRISAAGWTASARIGPRRLEVAVTPRAQDLIGTMYADPRGGSRYCYHTEVADLELVLSNEGREPIVIRRPAAAAFEYASESPVAGVPLVVT